MHTTSLYEQADRRTYTWFHTVHQHMYEADTGPTRFQKHVQRAKTIIAAIPVPGLSCAELRESHDFQHNRFINTKPHN